MLKLAGVRIVAPQPLEQALIEKEHELECRKRDLHSPYYAGDEWIREQIALLEGHIAEIGRFLSDGGKLDLPSCCNDPESICLAAIKGFDSCILMPDNCRFKLKKAKSIVAPQLVGCDG
jgi:hypothetical protein